MADYVFGANILENLTTGMYQDSRVIYREYIQNACDQIDVACKEGILSDKSEGRINIYIDAEKRTVTIEDNATGIAQDKFQETLANIADSDKRVGESKGFRGIGRLCGLAYCRELVFTSKYKGEKIISKMICDARKMRDLISQSTHGEKITASDVLRQIYEFTTEPCEDIDGHWFRVELIGVNQENRDLLDLPKIKDYLSFIAPVPYMNKFCFREKIYEHATSLAQRIDEYRITLNGQDVLKNYGTHFKTSKGEDEIFGVAFKDFLDANGQLIAWMWFGESKFKAIIEKDCQMRGIRLRKENIQIGTEDALQKLFREDRGNHYFIGEVFAVAKELIPNSQRDYFNENQARVEFEKMLKEYFSEVLHRAYYDASAINSAYKKIDVAKAKEADHHRKLQDGDYIDDAQKEQAEQEVIKARQDAEKARRDLEKKSAGANPLASKIIERNNSEREQKDREKAQISPKPENLKGKEGTKSGYRADKLSQYTRKERKLISRIFSIIHSATDKESAEKIISKIEEELQ